MGRYPHTELFAKIDFLSDREINWVSCHRSIDAGGEHGWGRYPHNALFIAIDFSSDGEINWVSCQ